MDATPQLKEMFETLRGTSNKRNADFSSPSFIKMSSPIIYIYTTCCSYIHSVNCLTTGSLTLKNLVPHRVRSRASSFNFQYPLFS